MTEHPFLYFLKLGKIRFEKGWIIVFDGTNILLPTRVLIFMMKYLREKFGEEEMKNAMKEFGKFQLKQALIRYKEIFKIDKWKKEDFFDFGAKIASMLGFGEIEIREREVIMYNSPVAFEYIEMLGLSKEPIDIYMEGILEEAYKAYLGKEVRVKEVECLAKGDKFCRFVIEI